METRHTNYFRDKRMGYAGQIWEGFLWEAVLKLGRKLGKVSGVSLPFLFKQVCNRRPQSARSYAGYWAKIGGFLGLVLL